MTTKQSENEKKNHLPIFGIGPALCFPMVILSAIGIILSVKGIIPGTVVNPVYVWISRILGILLIIEGIASFIGADVNGAITKSIKENKLKTNGSYQFVRNPCYAVYLLGSTGALLIAHNPVLLFLPLLFWIEMTIVLKNTEEKWLSELYGEEYADYCRKVNRCIPWFAKKGK